MVSQQFDAPAPGAGQVLAQSASEAQVGAHTWPEPVLDVVPVVVVVVADVVFVVVTVVVAPPPLPPVPCVSLPEAQAARKAGTMKERVMKVRLARFTGMW